MFYDPLETAANVDLGRYLGRWFEIARLPNPRQSDECIGARIDYVLDDHGTLRFSRHCIEAGGSSRTDEGCLTSTDVRRAKLRVSFMPDGWRWLPFTRRDYWILRIDDDYSMVLVGARNRRRLWLLARTRHPDPTMRDDFLAYAERQGYDLTALLYPQQERMPAIREWPASDAQEAGTHDGQALLQAEAVRVERNDRPRSPLP